MDNAKLRLAALGIAFALFGAVDLLVLLLTPAPQRGAALVPPLVAACVVIVALPALLSLFERQEEHIERQRREIETLHAMDTAIASEMELSRLLDVAVHKTLVALDADACGVALFDARSGKLEAEAYAAPDMTEDAALTAFKSRVRGGAARADDEEFELLTAPLTWSEARAAGQTEADRRPASPHGYLVAARRKPRKGFGEQDRRHLDALAGTVVVAVTNAHALAAAREAVRVREELDAERRERERDRAVAQALTEGLLPEIPPRAGRWAFSMRYLPQSDEAPVGGDVYDLFRLGGHRWGVVIADVSGKGLAAARQTAMVKYALRSYAREHPEPARVLERLNDALFDEPGVTGFVTLLYGVLDERSGTFTYASAGHETPVVRRRSLVPGDPPTFEALSPTGPVLGAIPASDYEEGRVELAAGDGILLFTDGLSEARTEGGDFLDIDGVQRLLTECRDCAPEAVADSLLTAARAFTGGRLADDTAVLWVEFMPPEPVGVSAGNTFAASPGNTATVAAASARR
jgi:serine phosphatase RsbU (regulator of sigma subunit)